MSEHVIQSKSKIWRFIAIAASVVGAKGALSLWNTFFKPSGPGEGFVSGNGRVEATEIDVATKLAGRIDEIMAAEGDVWARCCWLKEANR